MFISFSRQKAFDESPDAYNLAKELYSELDNAGCKSWMDEEGLGYGEGLANGIFTALKKCSIIIPVMTRGYAQSLWCLREFYYTSLQEPEKTIFPILFEDEDEIKNELAGEWLASLGGAQKYIEPRDEDGDEKNAIMIRNIVQDLKSRVSLYVIDVSNMNLLHVYLGPCFHRIPYRLDRLQWIVRKKTTEVPLKVVDYDSNRGKYVLNVWQSYIA